MNTHLTLYSPAVALGASEIKTPLPASVLPFPSPDPKRIASSLLFRKIRPADMPAIWEILSHEKGRTTDFSYGGILMWVNYFHYEFAIVDDTLFIKGRVESNISQVAFSLPVGKLPLPLCINILKEYCKIHDLPLTFSAVPEYAMENMRRLNPSGIEELSDWGDYLYSAESLATLRGKKLGKKRNHVNQFLSKYPDYIFERLTPRNADEAIAFMDLIDKEGDMNEMAVTERALNREMLEVIKNGDQNLVGAILRDKDSNILAFTIGDVKGDTLFIHIEKALRETPGAFEMINKKFAEAMVKDNPQIEYINREDDSGDAGLRQAKLSYYPVEILKKYNVCF